MSRTIRARDLARAAVIVIGGSVIALACIGQGEGKATLDDGKRLYQSNCAQCHGDAGDRIPLAPLNSKEFLDSRGDATLLAVVSEGKGVMPAWSTSRGGPFNENQIRSVVAYISSKAGRTSASVLADTGREVFLSNCIRCHGEKGDRIPVAPLSAKSFLDSRTDSQLIDVISEGRGMMPAWSQAKGGSLSENQVRSVVAYLRYNVDANVAASARLGRDLYLGNCIQCHGEKGDRIPKIALASGEYLEKLGDGALISAINEGKASMPGLGKGKGGTFTVVEIAAVLAYLKSWAGVNATSALAGPGVPGEGKDLFAQNCAPCHGPNGDRVTGVQLKSKEYLDSRTDRVLIQTITNGNSKGMPAWGRSAGGPLSEEQISSVMGYLKSAAGSGGTGAAAAGGSAPAPAGGGAAPPSNSPALASKGKEIYTKTCVACHGETRDKIPTCPLADKSWLEQKGDAALAQSIANGKGPMPAWGKAKGGPLSDEDVAAVLAYLKAEAGAGGGTAGANGEPNSGLTQPVSTRPAPSQQQGGGGLPQAGALTTPNLDLGREIFTSRCAMCHGNDGLRIPQCPLGSASWIATTGEEGLRARISAGKPGAGMPTWGESRGGPFSNVEISSIILYLWDLAQQNGSAPRR